MRIFPRRVAQNMPVVNIILAPLHSSLSHTIILHHTCQTDTLATYWNLMFSVGNAQHLVEGCNRRCGRANGTELARAWWAASMDQYEAGLNAD